MKKRFPILFSLICVLILSFGCYSKTEREIKNMLSHKFDFCGYSACSDYESNQSFTIVSYVDSIGCVECKLGFNNWKRLKEKIDNQSRKIRICFIVHPSAQKEMDFLLNDSPYHPDDYFIDYDNKVCIANQIPKDFLLQTFLLSPNNEVLLVGNPSQNQRIEQLLFEMTE